MCLVASSTCARRLRFSLGPHAFPTAFASAACGTWTHHLWQLSTDSVNVLAVASCNPPARALTAMGVTKEVKKAHGCGVRRTSQSRFCEAGDGKTFPKAGDLLRMPGLLRCLLHEPPPEPAFTKSLRMHYTGRFASSGQVFDSSQGKEPLEFTAGIGQATGPGFQAGICYEEQLSLQVIRGWDEGDPWIASRRMPDRIRIQPDLILMRLCKCPKARRPSCSLPLTSRDLPRQDHKMPKSRSYQDRVRDEVWTSWNAESDPTER